MKPSGPALTRFFCRVKIISVLKEPFFATDGNSGVPLGNKECDCRPSGRKNSCGFLRPFYGLYGGSL